MMNSALRRGCSGGQLNRGEGPTTSPARCAPRLPQRSFSARDDLRHEALRRSSRPPLPRARTIACRARSRARLGIEVQVGEAGEERFALGALGRGVFGE